MVLSHRHWGLVECRSQLLCSLKWWFHRSVLPWTGLPLYSHLRDLLQLALREALVLLEPRLSLGPPPGRGNTRVCQLIERRDASEITSGWLNGLKYFPMLLHYLLILKIDLSYFALNSAERLFFILTRLHLRTHFLVSWTFSRFGLVLQLLRIFVGFWRYLELWKEIPLILSSCLILIYAIIFVMLDALHLLSMERVLGSIRWQLFHEAFWLELYRLVEVCVANLFHLLFAFLNSVLHSNVDVRLDHLA